MRSVDIKDAAAFVEGMRHNTHLQGLQYVTAMMDRVEIGGAEVHISSMRVRAISVAHSLLTSRLYCCTFSEAGVFIAMMDVIRENANIRELNM